MLRASRILAATAACVRACCGVRREETRRGRCLPDDQSSTSVGAGAGARTSSTSAEKASEGKVSWMNNVDFSHGEPVQPAKAC